MIKKLKRKFVLVNMLLVALILLITFVTLIVYNRQRILHDSGELLRRALDKVMVAADPPDGKKVWLLPAGGPHGLAEPGGAMLAVAYRLDGDGGIAAVVGEGSVVSDTDQQAVIAYCLGAEKAAGIVPDYGLRYARRDTGAGVALAFVSRGYEVSTLTSLVITSALVGAGSLAAFFGLSLFLAGWAIQPVARSWEQQRQFVADASHELKTPLTVILANVGILKSHPAQTVESQARWLGYIEAEGERMTRLVADLLFLAKSDAAGRRAASLSPMDLSDVVTSGILPFEPVAFEQQKTLESAIEPGIGFVGDEGLIRQMVGILLDNACKYAEAGGRISAALAEQPGRICFTVANSGEPIPPEALPHIFERFYRADKSRVRQEGGYGLGLAIARQIATLHGGRIEAESGPNGTVFSVYLPKNKSNQRSAV